MSSAHRIRAAVADDAALILELIHGLAEYEHLLDQLQATEQRIRDTLFPSGGELPAAHCVIGEVDGVPAGFAVYFFTYSTFLAQPGLYLEDLFVRPPLRGRGLGKALLLHVAAIARERGCGRMEWAVLDWNAPSIEFYERLGARRHPEWQLCRLLADDLERLAER